MINIIPIFYDLGQVALDQDPKKEPASKVDFAQGTCLWQIGLRYRFWKWRIQQANPDKLGITPGYLNDK